MNRAKHPLLDLADFDPEAGTYTGTVANLRFRIWHEALNAREHWYGAVRDGATLMPSRPTWRSRMAAEYVADALCTSLRWRL